MRLLPAIDLMTGAGGSEVVRLTQGRAETRVVYSADPLAQARAFAAAGAHHLHVVDLDAAFRRGENRAAIARLAAESGLRVQVGGGLSDLEGIETLLASGVWRVVVGSAAIENPELVSRAVERFGPERVAVGIDARDGRVRIRGWTEAAGRSAGEVAGEMAARGVTTLVYTDIARDGMLGAPDLEGAVALARESGCRVVVSGGVAELAHIAAAAAHPERERLDGVIVGKALYEGRIDLAAALRALGEEAAPC